MTIGRAEKFSDLVAVFKDEFEGTGDAIVLPSER